jgi:hypothetical protein
LVQGLKDAKINLQAEVGKTWSIAQCLDYPPSTEEKNYLARRILRHREFVLVSREHHQTRLGKERCSTRAHRFGGADRSSGTQTGGNNHA